MWYPKLLVLVNNVYFTTFRLFSHPQSSSNKCDLNDLYFVVLCAEGHFSLFRSVNRPVRVFHAESPGKVIACSNVIRCREKHKCIILTSRNVE